MRTPSERYYAPYGCARTPTGRAGNAGKRVVEIATVLEHGGLDKLKLYWLAPEIEFAGLHKTQHDTLEQRKVAYLQ